MGLSQELQNTRKISVLRIAALLVFGLTIIALSFLLSSSFSSAQLEEQIPEDIKIYYLPTPTPTVAQQGPTVSPSVMIPTRRVTP